MANKQLEAFRQTLVLRAALCQRRYLHRIHCDECGLNELFLHTLVKAGVQRVAPSGLRRLRQLHTDGFGRGNRLGIVGDGAEVDACILLHGVHHSQAAPARRKVDLFAQPLHLIAAQQLQRGRGKDPLGNVHHRMEIRIRLIQLHGRKFRVMLRVHALVAENTADLIHAVDASYDQPLERQLCGDTHIHINIQRVVVGHERTRRSPACDGVQHRRFHFHIAALIQVIAHMANKFGAHLKRLAHLRVDDQVHIALAVPRLAVLQAVEFFWQRQQALAQQYDLGDMHADFAHLRTEHKASDADDIADIKFLERLILLHTHVVPADIKLDVARGVPKVRKAGLAHHALAHHAARHAHAAALFTLGHVHKALFHLGGKIRLGIACQLKGVVSGLLQAAQLFAPDGDQLVIRLLTHFFGYGPDLLLGCLQRIAQLFQRFVCHACPPTSRNLSHPV